MNKQSSKSELLHYGGDKANAPEYWRQLIGRLGEEVAVRHFQETGHEVMERNWRSGRFAEIDLISRRRADNLIIFAEVKTRRNWHGSGFQDFGFENITARKKQKMLVAARRYLHCHCPDHTDGYQCDVVLITYNGIVRNGEGNYQLANASVLHVPAAFSSL